jgi:cell division septation protein DedD
MMREAFDDDDLEKKDTEITLGLPSLLGIFFGLVLICGIFFGFGYTLGRGSSHSNNATNPPASTPAATSDSSLAPNGGAAKPSAQQSLPPAAAAPTAANGSTAAVTPAVATTTAGQQPGTVLAATATPAPAVKTVPTPMTTAAAPQPGPAARPATPAQVYMVQVAAVENPADAAVLMSALRQHGYHVMERRLPQDTLTHVQIGPFESRAAANQMRQRLQADGYNAILKP